MSSVACGSAAGFIVGTPGSTCGGGWWEVCCLSAGLIIRKRSEPFQLIKHLLHLPVGSVKIWLLIILSAVGLFRCHGFGLETSSAACSACFCQRYRAGLGIRAAPSNIVKLR